MKWFDQAPANIALIKYMGKVDANTNTPTNSSFSYTLDHLLTFVEMEQHDKPIDCWEPLQHESQHDFQLSEQGQQRFLRHLKFLKEKFNCDKHFIVRSTNNFPADCGLASSASSYAALTKCALKAICELTNTLLPDISVQAKLSQQASGSSCRSFSSPWVLWKKTSVEPIEVSYTNLIHQTIVVDKAKKSISSSAAHQLVKTSSLFNGRAKRSEQRLMKLLGVFKDLKWKLAYDIVWQEFWDMHALFETAGSPFGYMTADSMKVLNLMRTYWQENKDGPLVTMDAGPNVHLLYRHEQQESATEIERLLNRQYQVIST